MAKKNPLAAVIDIGSNELRLHIAQAIKAESETGKVKYLESLRYPLSLGRDTFQAGKMSFDKSDKACEVIKNFQHVMRGYGVRSVRTLAATAVREAANMEYILDQIKIKTGITVDVLDDLEEKRYIYKLLSYYAGEHLKQSAIMVYIGTGSIGVSLLLEGKMPRTWNIRVGSLRMGELFGGLEEYTSEFFRLMEEYLAGLTNQLSKQIPDNIQHFIVSGQEIDMIAKLTGATLLDYPESNSNDCSDESDRPLFDIPRDNFLALYDRIKRKTVDWIATEFDLSGEKADTLLPAVCIYQNLMAFTKAEYITASRILPCDAVLFEMLYPKRFSSVDKRFTRSTVHSVKILAQQYQPRVEHYELVVTYALMIFDKIKKIHGLGSRDKLLLEAAAILHDIGEYVNIQDHEKLTYGIVRGSDIVGLNQMEIEIIALICRYHSQITPSISEHCYARLDASTRVRVSKLTAILRVADALDRSHIQKFSRIDVKLTDTAMIITVNAHADVSLEQWSFNQKGQFFEEVFGIKAQLRVKKLS